MGQVLNLTECIIPIVNISDTVMQVRFNEKV